MNTKKQTTNNINPDQFSAKMDWTKQPGKNCQSFKWKLITENRLIEKTALAIKMGNEAREIRKKHTK